MSPTTKQILKRLQSDCNKAFAGGFIKDITSVSLVCVHSAEDTFNSMRPVYVQVVIEGTHPASDCPAAITLLNYICPKGKATRFNHLEQIASGLSKHFSVPLNNAVRFSPSRLGNCSYVYAFMATPAERAALNPRP